MNKISPWLCLPGILLAGRLAAAPTTESTSLSLMLTQFDMLESTLHRAENQARIAPGERFFFDYPQAYADIQTLRAEIEHYLTPSRAQPHTVLPLSGQYRVEEKP